MRWGKFLAIFSQTHRVTLGLQPEREKGWDAPLARSSGIGSACGTIGREFEYLSCIEMGAVDQPSGI
jgi:hypothetical protein